MIPNDIIGEVEREWETCPTDITKFCIMPYLKPKREKLTIVHGSKNVSTIIYDKTSYTIGANRSQEIGGMLMRTYAYRLHVWLDGRCVALPLPPLLPGGAIVTIFNMTNYAIAIIQRHAKRSVLVYVGPSPINNMYGDCDLNITVDDESESTLIKSCEKNEVIHMSTYGSIRTDHATGLRINSQGLVSECN